MKERKDEILEMRKNGATFQEIADSFGVSKQRVNEVFHKQTHGRWKRMRGHGFDIETIVYKGLYEHFKNNVFESVTSFSKKVYGHSNTIPLLRKFIKGELDSHFSITQIKKMCEITGKSFEELFEKRD